MNKLVYLRHQYKNLVDLGVARIGWFIFLTFFSGILFTVLLVSSPRVPWIQFPLFIATGFFSILGYSILNGFRKKLEKVLHKKNIFIKK